MGVATRALNFGRRRSASRGRWVRKKARLEAPPRSLFAYSSRASARAAAQIVGPPLLFQGLGTELKCSLPRAVFIFAGEGDETPPSCRSAGRARGEGGSHRRAPYTPRRDRNVLFTVKAWC